MKGGLGSGLRGHGESVIEHLKVFASSSALEKLTKKASAGVVMSGATCGEVAKSPRR